MTFKSQVADLLVVGFGNIFYIISYTCSFIKNKSIPIFIKAEKNISEKTYNDALAAVNYLNFNNFNINFLSDEKIFKNGIELPNAIALNDNSNNTYIINKTIKGQCNFFTENIMITCKNLPVFFKNYNLINNKFYKLFKQIKNEEKYIVINVRRGEKLNIPKYLITTPEMYFDFIKNNSDKKIIFVSDDIEWCKKNFKNYNNILFNEYNEKDKILMDQFIMFNSYELIINVDCTFSHIPHLLKDNKIRKLKLLVKKELYEYVVNNKASRYNIIKNYYLKNNLLDECVLIGV